MRLFSTLCSLLLLAPYVFAQTEDHTIRRLDGSVIKNSEAQALAERVLKENNVTGAEIAVLNDGHMVWVAGFGLRDKQNNLPMAPVTTTWAASITKGVFAVYVMTLVEKHQLDLDKPIADLLRPAPRQLSRLQAYRR